VDILYSSVFWCKMYYYFLFRNNVLKTITGPPIILSWCNQTLQVFWNVTPCRLVSSNLNFLALKGWALEFNHSSNRSYKLLVANSNTKSHTRAFTQPRTLYDLERESSTVFLKAGRCLPVVRAHHSRRLESSAKPPWETSNFRCVTWVRVC